MKHGLTAIGIFVSASFAYGCDCILYPVETYVDKTELIFTGKVIGLLDQMDSLNFMGRPRDKDFRKRGYRVKVVVITKIKTGQLRQDTLEFTSDYTHCDPIYMLGKSYLFFAEKSANGKYKMTHCTPWGLLSERRTEIRKLKLYLRKTGGK